MIRLAFSINREPMNFIVKGREIYYSDRRWNNWIRCIPQPENFMKIVALSRNRIPMAIANLFKLTPEEMKEYENAKTENDLADIIIRDAKSKGCVFISRSNELLEEDNIKGVIT